jgi:predicted ATP-binding protein involved in virulence
MLFSTNRAVPSERAPAKGMAAGGIDTAFADTFANRELRLGEFAEWIRVQESLRKERPASARVLSALGKAVTRFLPGYGNMRLAGDKGRRLVIDRGSTTIPVRQLSDGERGTLALVVDLTRRLAQANPNLTDPAAKAGAVVLIDEIDLHLHPKWQRQIVHNLRAAFPQCQFIATTHSPQVIGEVEHDRIQIMADRQVYSPKHSYGVDSSRVLEEVMGSDPRTKEVGHLLSRISGAIGQQQFTQARKLLVQAVARLGETDPEVTRIRTLLDFVEGKE